MISPLGGLEVEAESPRYLLKTRNIERDLARTTVLSPASGQLPNHRHHGLIPLLSQAELPHPGQYIWGESRINRNNCHASAETLLRIT
jgi:hypothetical protein